MPSAVLGSVMATPKKSAKGRFDMQAPQSWLDRAARIAENLGLSLSAYVRMVVTEDMDRREPKDPKHPKQQ